MDLEYTGPVLNKAGKMFACAHYEALNYGTGPTAGTGITALTNLSIDRLSGNIALIKNGLYNQNVDLAGTSVGISQLWTPESALDYTFGATIQGLGTASVYNVANKPVSVLNTATATPISADDRKR